MRGRPVGREGGVALTKHGRREGRPARSDVRAWEAGAARLASAPPYGVGVRRRGATGGGPAGERRSGRGPGPRPGSQLLTWRRGEWRGETVGGKRPCPVHPAASASCAGSQVRLGPVRPTPPGRCHFGGLAQPRSRLRGCPRARPALGPGPAAGGAHLS